MRLPLKAQEAQFIKRYKRFFADVILEERPLTVHVPNSGSMKGCLNPDSRCLITLHGDPKKKLPGTLHFIRGEHSWVGVDTSLPNKIVAEILREKKYPRWNFLNFASEVKINDESRLDFVGWNFENSNKPSPEDFKNAENKFHCIEVKNVSLVENRIARFPDAESVRAQKHLKELMHMVQMGHDAEILFVTQRTDFDRFEPAIDIDPDYARLFNQALISGVRASMIETKVEVVEGQLELISHLREDIF